MNLIDILTRYMTPFEARLCIQEMRRCGVLPPDIKVIEGEWSNDATKEPTNETTN